MESTVCMYCKVQYMVHEKIMDNSVSFLIPRSTDLQDSTARLYVNVISLLRFFFILKKGTAVTTVKANRIRIFLLYSSTVFFPIFINVIIFCN